MRLTPIIITLMFLGCFSNSNQKIGKNNTQSISNTDSLKNFTEKLTEKYVDNSNEEEELDITGWQHSNKRKVFCLVEKIDGSYYINEYSKLIIYDDKILFDWLDMEPFTFRIKEITYSNNSIVKFQIDKQSSGIVYNNIIKWTDLWDRDREFGTFIKNKETFIWEVFYNDERFKWDIIDSLDIKYSNMPILELDEDNYR